MSKIYVYYKNCGLQRIVDIKLTKEDWQRGYIYIPCEDCEGTGQFELLDDEYQQCVLCRGIGKVICGLW